MDEAISLLKEVAETSPTYIEKRFNIVRCFYCKSYLEIDPHHPTCLHARVVALLQKTT